MIIILKYFFFLYNDYLWAEGLIYECRELLKENEPVFNKVIKLYIGIHKYITY